jgi:hypothetical protein
VSDSIKKTLIIPEKTEITLLTTRHGWLFDPFNLFVVVRCRPLRSLSLRTRNGPELMRGESDNRCLDGAGRVASRSDTGAAFTRTVKRSYVSRV